MFKEIAQRDIPIVVETAWHHCAVGKHAYLVAQGITESLFTDTLFTLAVRPLEHAVILKIYVIGHAPTVVTLNPRTRHMLFKQFYKPGVCCIITALVPQTQHDYRSARSSLLCKTHDTIDILREVLLSVSLMRMERYLHLMRKRPDYILCLVKQSTVSGEHRYETFFTRGDNELWQMSMQQRFTHQVEIEELDLTTQTVGKAIELLRCETALGTHSLWTEYAVKVTDVRYLKIATGNHTKESLIDHSRNRIHDTAHMT